MDLTEGQIIRTIDIFAVAIPLLLLLLAYDFWLVSLIVTVTIAILVRVFFRTSNNTTNQIETDQTPDFADDLAEQLLDGKITVEEYETKVENILNSVPQVVASNKALEVNVDAVLVEEESEK
jgi:uncharacterized membrane protein